METISSNEQAQTTKTLYISVMLLGRITQSAQQHHRSANGEILAAIEHWLFQQTEEEEPKSE